MCNRCILKAYTTLITNEINNNRISLIFISKAILATLAAIVIIILSTLIFTGSYRIISAIIALGCFKFVYGIWRHDVINNIIQYKNYSRQLSQLSDIVTIPKEALDDEFKREGKRILNILEKEKSENIHGNYKLPRHREHGELPVWAGTLIKSVPTIRTFCIWGSEEESNSHKPKQGGKYSSLFNLVLWKE